jgi:cytochrome c-type biogenesis protein CcmH/NrfG
LEIEKDNIDFLLLLASIQVELKNYQEARDVLEKILEITPKNMDAIAMLKDLGSLPS